MAGSSSEQDDRVFVRDGWRHYRRRYSLTEVRGGLACFPALLGIAGGVAWKGALPDPALFADGAALLKAATPATGVAPATVAPPTASAGHPGSAADRGPLPA